MWVIDLLIVNNVFRVYYIFYYLVEDFYDFEYFLNDILLLLDLLWFI